MFSNHKLFYVPKQINNKTNQSFKRAENSPTNVKKAIKQRSKKPMFNPYSFLLNPSNQKPTKLVTLNIQIPNMVNLKNKHVDHAINYFLITKDEASLIALCNNAPVHFEKQYNHPEKEGIILPLLTLAIELNLLIFVDFALNLMKSKINNLNHKIVHHAITAEMIVLLHKHKININTLNSNGNTRLCKFATAGYFNAVKLIIENCNPNMDHAIYKLLNELILNHLSLNDEKENQLIYILKYLIIKKNDMDMVRNLLAEEYSHLAEEYGYLLKDCKQSHGHEEVHFLWILQKNLEVYINKQKILDKLWNVYKEAKHDVELNKILESETESKSLKL